MIKRLSEATGVSGYEKQVREIVISELKGYADLRTDKLGNLIAVSNKGTDKPSVVLTAHMDEPGLIITDITDDGYLKFDTIGDINPATLLSQRVIIGDHVGIISFKAIHLTTKEERKKAVKTSDLLIDIGADTKAEAKSLVRVGDLCAFDTEFSEFGENSIKGKALTSRVSCAVLIDILKRSAEFDLNITGIFTVQREISSRGAHTALDGVLNADLAIITDAADCGEKINSGGGAVVGFSSDLNRESATVADYAESHGIKVQRAVTNKTEREIFLSKRYDIPVVVISIPCKYKNTAVNIMDKNDIRAVSELIVQMIRSGEDGTFI